MRVLTRAGLNFKAQYWLRVKAFGTRSNSCRPDSSCVVKNPGTEFFGYFAILSFLRLECQTTNVNMTKAISS